MHHYENSNNTSVLYKSMQHPDEKQHFIQNSNIKMHQSFSNLYTPTEDQMAACRIQMNLEEKALWQRFHSLTNEMILTKAGRRTFPLIKTCITGLESQTIYSVEIEFQLADNQKYRFVNGEWRNSNRTEVTSSHKSKESQSVFYTHPDSPNFGYHWMSNMTTFSKLKLTNNEIRKANDLVYLKSLHKYQPIIHVYKLIDKTKYRLQSFAFSETQFIAVTAYQNEQITGLKIKYNPFAKAFLDTKPICIESETRTLIQDVKSAKDKQVKAEVQSENQFETSNMSLYSTQSNQLFYPNSYYTSYDYASSFYNPYQSYQQQSYSLPIPFQPYATTSLTNTQQDTQLSVDTSSFAQKRNSHLNAYTASNLRKLTTQNYHDFQPSNLDLQQILEHQKLNTDFMQLSPPLIKKEEFETYIQQHHVQQTRLSLNAQNTNDSGIYSPTLSGLQQSDNSANDSQ